jgi:hypothetical protein
VGVGAVVSAYWERAVSARSQPALIEPFEGFLRVPNPDTVTGSQAKSNPDADSGVS